MLYVERRRRYIDERNRSYRVHYYLPSCLGILNHTHTNINIFIFT